MTKTYNLHCNIAMTLEIVGDRWTLLIIRDLLSSPRKFIDLKGSLVGISTNILSERLQTLEKHGLIESRLYSQHPPRYEYHLTESGQELRHVLHALHLWGNKHFDDVYADVVLPECGHTQPEILYQCPHCSTTANQLIYKPLPSPQEK